MPEIVSVVLREQLRLLKPILSKMDIKTARSAQEKLGQLGIRATEDKVDFFPIAFDNFEACYVRSNDIDPEEKRVILYLHGGAYVAGSIKYASGFAGLLAANTALQVFCVAYRLAPEHPFPAALEDALAAYKFLLENGAQARHIAFAGESAGGGLLYALCHKIRREGLPMPSRLIGISPWTDLTFSGESYITNKKKDPSLLEESLRYDAEVYAQGSESSPLVSPLFGDFDGFPPSLLFVGGDELILDDTTRLHEKLITSGCLSEMIVEPGLWHAYVLFGVPEAKQALVKINEFLEACNG